MAKATDNRLKCSFCGKSQEAVKKLIAGPGVCVCNECVELCNEILDEESSETQPLQQFGIRFLSLESRNLSRNKTTVPPQSFLEITTQQLIYTGKDDKSTASSATLTSDEHKQLVAEAAKALEDLLKLYIDSNTKASAEPLYRALLFLKAHQFGRNNKELMPVIEGLIDFYESEQEFMWCAYLLEWLVEICAANDLPEDQRRLYMTGLAKMFVKAGMPRDADETLDQLLQLGKQLEDRDTPNRRDVERLMGPN